MNKTNLVHNYDMSNTSLRSTDSEIMVFELQVNGVCVMRRCNDDWINATQLLKVALDDKTQRKGILREIQKGIHEKVTREHGMYKGIWIPLEMGYKLAENLGVYELLSPILEFDSEEETYPRAPKKSRKLNEGNGCLQLLLDGAGGIQLVNAMRFGDFDDKRRTPLHWAVALGRCNAAILLLQNIIPETVDNAGMTPLMLAVNFPDCLKVLSVIIPFLNASHCDIFGRNVLHHTVLTCLLEHIQIPTALQYLKIILDSDRSFVNDADNNGLSPLELAALMGLNPLVAMLKYYDGSTANITLKQQDSLDKYNNTFNPQQNFFLPPNAENCLPTSFKSIKDLENVSFAFYNNQINYPMFLRKPNAVETLAALVMDRKCKVTPLDSPSVNIFIPLIQQQDEMLDMPLATLYDEIPKENVDTILSDLLMNTL